MQIKRSSDYVQKAQEYNQPPKNQEPEIDTPELSQKKISGENKLATSIGLVAVFIIIALSFVFLYAVNIGAIKLNLTPELPHINQDQATKQSEHFVNGPYTEINMDATQKTRSKKIVIDNSLIVVNDRHFLLNDVQVDVVNVPFEQHKATAECAEAYKKLNLAISREFETPIDLMQAYIAPDEPGHSDPENIDNTLGLALDLKAPGYKIENFQNSKKGQFTAVHAQDFGLILRYPNQKSDVTGMPYISYKYRYVGFPHSVIITKENLALDEYPDYLGFNKELEFEGYVISRQKGPTVKYPKDAVRVHISEDNMGAYIVTAQMFEDDYPYPKRDRVRASEQTH